jgi:hypothetical protein
MAWLRRSNSWTAAAGSGLAQRTEGGTTADLTFAEVCTPSGAHRPNGLVFRCAGIYSNQAFMHRSTWSRDTRHVGWIEAAHPSQLRSGC